MTRRRVCLGKYRRTSFGLIKPVIRVPKQKTNCENKESWSVGHKASPSEMH